MSVFILLQWLLLLLSCMLEITYYNLINILIFNYFFFLDNTEITVFSQSNVVHGSGYLFVGRKCEAALKLPHE